jgi:hypothetical protein
MPNGGFIILRGLSMHIEEVVNESVLALYADPELAEHLFLKGGTALRLFENLAARLSVDADFSTDQSIEDPESFFQAIETALTRRFLHHNLDVLDFQYKRKPKTQRTDRPDWWGEWLCEFKLCSGDHRGTPLENRRRNALIPRDAVSPKIPLEISDHEYCGTGQVSTIQGIPVQGYTRELLVLEKMRAICQQHPDYPYRLKKNRARDFYDIQQLTQNPDDDFVESCRNQIDKVFAAKEVPLTLLADLWNDSFTSLFTTGFELLESSIRGKILPFEYYLNHTRFLVETLLPDLRES